MIRDIIAVLLMFLGTLVVLLFRYNEAWNNRHSLEMELQSRGILYPAIEVLLFENCDEGFVYRVTYLDESRKYKQIKLCY